MKNLKLSLFLLVCFLGQSVSFKKGDLCFSFARAHAANKIATNNVKDQWVQNLSVLIKSLDQRLRQLDDRTSDAIDKVEGLSLTDLAHYEAIRTDIRTFDMQRTDLINRMDFFESLRTYFTDLYSNQPLRAFITDRISALVRQGIGIGISRRYKDPENFYLELLDLKMALSGQLSNDQNMLDFMDGFFEKYNKSNPLGSLRSLRDFNYSDGAVSEPVRNVTLEEAGEVVLKKFGHLQNEGTLQGEVRFNVVTGFSKEVIKKADIPGTGESEITPTKANQGMPSESKADVRGVIAGTGQDKPVVVRKTSETEGAIHSALSTAKGTDLVPNEMKPATDTAFTFDSKK